MPKKKEIKKGEILFISPKNIEVKKGFNPRSNVLATVSEDFKTNVKKFGVLQPLRVAAIKANKGQYKLIDGERRLRAALNNNLDLVPVILSTPKNEAEALMLTLTLSSTGEKLLPMDEAKAYQKLIKQKKCSQRVLAKALGISHQTVANRIALINAPAEVKDAIEDGKITTTQASKISSKTKKVATPKKKKAVVKAAVKTATTQRTQKPLSLQAIHDIIEAKTNIMVKTTGDENTFLRGMIQGLAIAGCFGNKIKVNPFEIKVKTIVCARLNKKHIPLERCDKLTKKDYIKNHKVHDQCKKCSHYRRYVLAS